MINCDMFKSLCYVYFHCGVKKMRVMHYEDYDAFLCLGRSQIQSLNPSRQAKTDFIMLGPEQEVYEPGRYSEDPLSSKLSWIFRGFDM